jgi:hypothetical protein
LRPGRTDVESAPLLEIALRRVKSVLTSVQALREALELGLAHVQRPLPPLDRRLEIRGLRLARAEPLLGDRQPGAALGQLGRELIQLRLALVELGELLLCLLEPPLLLAEIAQPVRDLGLGGGEPACAGFELLRQQVDPRLTLVDLGRAAPRVLLARLELRRAAAPPQRAASRARLVASRRARRLDSSASRGASAATAASRASISASPRA